MTISISSSRRATIGALTIQLLVTTLAGPVALPGCPESCGGIRVPYPFGIGQGCFHEGFNLTCDETQHPPKLFLGHGMEVLGISLLDGTVRIRSKVLHSATPDAEFNVSWSGPLATWPFTMSGSYNWFVAFGCNIVARIIPRDTLGSADYSSTCAAMCVDSKQNPTAGSSCSGIGRCQTSIPWGPYSYGIHVTHLAMQESIGRSSRDTAVFIVDQDWFSRNEDEMLTNFTQGRIYADDSVLPPSFRKIMVQSVPVVLEWWLDLISDEDMFALRSIGPNSSDWGCLSSNSFSYLVGGNYDRRRCNCSKGYEGNPYIANGCQCINDYFLHVLA